ncbi:MAG: TIGR00730 family Rossman fold protein [Pseudomonadota bacterium]
MSAGRKTICLFCGSRHGNDPDYADAAAATARGLAEGGFDLVYGAGDVGLMGIAARAAKQAGARVLGFIPRHILELEIGCEAIDATVITETMHERKKLMFVNSDAVLALPGGPGTLDELIEVLTWRQLGVHERPVVLFNHKGYWDPFLRLLEHMARTGFMGESFLDYVTETDSPEGSVEALHRLLDRP